jgi:hypothetical protein
LLVRAGGARLRTDVGRGLANAPAADLIGVVALATVMVASLDTVSMDELSAVAEVITVTK